MAQGSDLPPSVAAAIGIPHIPPTREFLAVMRDLWKRTFAGRATVSVSAAPATYDQTQMQEIVDAVKELQDIQNAD